VADGRGAAARPRTRWLWLPGPDGSVGPAEQVITAEQDEMRDTGWHPPPLEGEGHLRLRGA
jgi:hypothetical protein